MDDVGIRKLPRPPRQARTPLQGNLWVTAYGTLRMHLICPTALRYGRTEEPAVLELLIGTILLLGLLYWTAAASRGMRAISTALKQAASAKASLPGSFTFGSAAVEVHYDPEEPPGFAKSEILA